VASPGFFVTGCARFDPRTHAACALVRALRKSGIDVGAMKPVETGWHDRGREAVMELVRAAGDGDALDDVCPFPFELEASPIVAARAADRPIDPFEIESAFARISARRAAVIVEGAGGLLSTVCDGVAMAELAGRLGLPLVLVESADEGAAERLDLVCEAAMVRGLEVVGVILSRRASAAGPGVEAELDWLRMWLGGLLVGVVTAAEPGAEEQLDVSRILEELR
jgi:dethiobiotin synthetase